MAHEADIARACVELKWNILAVDPGAFTMKLAVARGSPAKPSRRKQVLRSRLRERPY
jgi:hypothetical protein